ncbi:hypothetical protein MTP99_015041 [Tenebrio molitor]|jgi:hypothetical protein|nr:hypothetical protein MTP99_015041 [Tenebrio molitor]
MQAAHVGAISISEAQTRGRVYGEQSPVCKMGLFCTEQATPPRGRNANHFLEVDKSGGLDRRPPAVLYALHYGESTSAFTLYPFVRMLVTSAKTPNLGCALSNGCCFGFG